MSTTPLSTNFKDDILASSNAKRKYQITYNDDGTISLDDVTQYSQTGSEYGAKEVNEERTAINNIDERRIVTLDEIDLVTEEGYFVDAKAAAELNSKLLVTEGTLQNQSGANYVREGSKVTVSGRIAMNAQTVTITLPYKTKKYLGFPVVGTDNSLHPTSGYTGRGICTANSNACDIKLAGANTFAFVNFTYYTDDAF